MRKLVWLMLVIALLLPMAKAQSSATCEALDAYEGVLSSQAVEFLKIEIDSVIAWLSEQDLSPERDFGRSIGEYWNQRFAPTIEKAGELIPERVKEALSRAWEYNRPEIRRERWGRTLINECTTLYVPGNESFVLRQAFRNQAIRRDVCSCFRERANIRIPRQSFLRMF